MFSCSLYYFKNFFYIYYFIAILGHLQKEYKWNSNPAVPTDLNFLKSSYLHTV